MNMPASLIRGEVVPEVATATPATDATEAKNHVESVAEVASVAVAEPFKPLPAWCSKSCPYLEELDLPDGKVMGCDQAHHYLKQVWMRLSSM